MKKSILTAIMITIAMMSTFAQTPAISYENIENPTFKLFQTSNSTTFIKLDTRNGKMWQVEFDANYTVNNKESILSSDALIREDKEIKGRFTLYPTHDSYYHILLDQINGDMYLVYFRWESIRKEKFKISKY